MNLSTKLTDQEKKSFMNSFDCYSQDKCIETNKKIIMNHFLKRWNEKKSIVNPSTCEFSPAETVDLKVYSIEPK